MNPERLDETKVTSCEAVESVADNSEEPVNNPAESCTLRLGNRACSYPNWYWETSNPRGFNLAT